MPPLNSQSAIEALLEALPRLRPDAGRDALEAALAGRGTLLRYRPHRAAFLFDGLHVKLYLPKDALEVGIGIFARDRGATSWRLGQAMRAAGLPTPEPLFLRVRKPWRIHRETILVTRALDAPVHLTDELKARLRDGRSAKPLLDGVAVLAARLHDAGFFHGDFTASNLVLEGAARTLSVIDLDRARDLRALPAPLRTRVQALDLRLLLLTTWGEVSRRSWLRLLARYFHARNFSRSEARRFARRVLSARRGRIRPGAKAPPLGGPTPWSS